MNRHKRILVSCCVHRNIIVYDTTIVQAEYSEMQALVLICSCIQRSRVRVPRIRVYAHTAISRFAFCLPRINLCEWNTIRRSRFACPEAFEVFSISGGGPAFPLLHLRYVLPPKASLFSGLCKYQEGLWYMYIMILTSPLYCRSIIVVLSARASPRFC